MPGVDARTRKSAVLLLLDGLWPAVQAFPRGRLCKPKPRTPAVVTNSKWRREACAMFRSLQDYARSYTQE